jgi:uncharacterized protein (DUF433 family)
MKSYKQYLAESKKTYEFKVKIAGEHPDNAVEQLKGSLSQFHCNTVSKGMTTPIQERHSEFPEHVNIGMTIYDVTTDYPATAMQIRDMVATGLGITHSHVVVRNMAEEMEHAINHQYDEISGEAIGGTMQEPSDHSNMINDTYKYNLLKELGKEKHQGTQITGINDQLLAKKAPSEKQPKVKSIKKSGTLSPVGTKQNKIPNPVKGN